MTALSSLYLAVFGFAATEVHLRSLPPAEATVARARLALSTSLRKSLDASRKNLRRHEDLGTPGDDPLLVYAREHEKYLERSLDALARGALPPPPPDIGPALFASLLAGQEKDVESTRQARKRLEADGNPGYRPVIDSLKSREGRLEKGIQRLRRGDLTPEPIDKP